MTETENLLPIEVIRHSAAHILAQAVQKLIPEAKLGIGPAIEDGFYYDFELPRPLSDTDLKEIENVMKKIIKEKQDFVHYDLSKEETIKKLSEQNQTYKLELVEDLDLPEYSFYENGPFVDLCKGPHCNRTNNLKAFKLLKVAGAYWKGSEKNPMLQRIYGTAFHTKEELKAYLTRLEEAKKRDHRVLGKELDLFSVNEDLGSGLILWHPKGALIRHLIETYWKEQHFQNDYDVVYSPHIGKSQLWETSGHLDCYNENMFAPMQIDEQNYFAKPMNCPFHIMIYNNTPHSYRQLPVRYAELGTVYRYERSGVLHGLMRVRGFTQDDAHIMCTPEQVEDEIESVLKFCQQILTKFGFDTIKTYISTRPEEKSVGDEKEWEIAEKSLRNAVSNLNIPFEVDEGGGAFYGPKIDIKIKDAIGREWQCSTIQFDFNLPERFNMTYVNSNGDKVRPIMIHRALLGSIERFFGILTEHFAGRFPTWLAPVQVKLLSVNQDTVPYGETVAAELKKAGIRVEKDFSDDKLGYKIRTGAKEKIPYMIIIGKNEVESKTLSVRSRDDGELGQLTTEEIIQKVNQNV